MRRILRERAVSVPLILGLCAALPAGLLHFLGPQEVHISPQVHFLPIAISSGLAAGAAVALTLAGARRGDGRAVLVGTAFSAMAALLAVHGLTTPGLLAQDNGVVAFSGALTLPVGGTVLALAALPGVGRARNVKRLLWLQGVLLTTIVGLGLAGILAPSLVPGVPEAGSTGAWALLVVGMSFYAMLALRAARTFLLTRRHADFLVVVGTVLLAAALPAALLLTYVDLGWWVGHGLELIGIGCVGVPVAMDLYRGHQSRPLAGDLRGAELVSAADDFLGPSVRALLVRLAEKDAYTEAHTRGVALRAVQVGDELGLPPARLRELAIGALLHDVGKLSVPDEILKKPAGLTDEEFDVIRRHPEWGYELVRELGGFSPLVAELVLDHHERLNGSGYPRGLHAQQLSLETRVLAVCDVFDALISNRVYRDAWSQEEALDLLRRASGVEFDARAVEALDRVLASDQTTGNSGMFHSTAATTNAAAASTAKAPVSAF